MSSLIGQKFGTLTVIEQLGSTAGKGVLCRFVCDCGHKQVWYGHEVFNSGKGKICPYCQMKDGSSMSAHQAKKGQANG
jgi:hypothetical protein